MAKDPSTLWRRLVVQRTGWTSLTPTQRAVADHLVQDMETLLDAHGVAPTPLVVLRVHDVLVSLLVTLQLERYVGEKGAASSGDDAKCAVLPEVESAAKARERLRKAMKELEDACARAGTPIDQGLADEVKPLLKQAEGITDDPKNLKKPAPASDPEDAPCD